MKKCISVLLCLCLMLSLFTGCSEDPAPETAPATQATEATKPIIPSVRLLCFQPELAESWDNLAAAYTAETGVPVTVVTCDTKNWEQTLERYLSEEDGPTLFQLCTPTGTSGWEDLCYDLSGTDAADALISGNYALTDGEAVLGLPCGVDAWGIWVNRKLLATTPFSLEDLTSQEGLKTVVDAVSSAEELGFTAFSVGLPEADAGRNHLALAAAAIAREYQRDSLTAPEKFRGTELEGLCSLLALMTQNAGDSQAFPEGKALFCPGSAADWASLSAVFSREDLALIPAYLDETEITPPGEDTDPTEETTLPEETEPATQTEAEEEADPQGLLIGADRFLCINPNAPVQDLPVTLDFLNWLLGTRKGAEALADMGFCLPYTTAPEPENPFLPKLKDRDLLYRRDWTMPSYQWQTALLNALTAWADAPTPGNREEAARAFAGYWTAEYALSDPTDETGESNG